jgi:hypothetical protein
MRACGAHAALLASLLAPLAAQEAPTLLALADAVAKAHRTEDAAPVSAFGADLRIEELARSAEEHRGQIELSVSFLDWKHPDTGRSYPLIRYKQTDSARSIEQGRDREDYWAYGDGKPLDMRSREMATDLDHARRNIKLARQMLQFLDADSVLRALKEPSAVSAEDLAQGRAAKTPSWVVRGKLASFPLRQQEGESAEVEAKIFVSRDEQRLVGIEVRPSAKQDSTAKDGADGKQPTPAQEGEFVLLTEHKTIDGRVVPTRIVHFAIGEDGKRRVQLGIDLTTLKLGSKLEAKDFDRPK